MPALTFQQLQNNGSTALAVIASLTYPDGTPWTPAIQGVVGGQAVNVTGLVSATISVPNTVFSGQQTGTASSAALPANNLFVGVTIEALSSNTGPVYVGQSGVTTTTGIELQPTAAVSIPIGNTNEVFIVGNGQVVSWIAS